MDKCIATRSHHLIKDLEQFGCCKYCGSEFAAGDWQSQWYMDKHYKVAVCSSCRRSAWMTVDFCGSGHDRWASNMERITGSIEDKVKTR